jgi:predicted lipoprotein with Yx(FWY)xxD motif
VPLSAARPKRRYAAAPLTVRLGVFLLLGSLFAGCASKNTGATNETGYVIGVRSVSGLGLVLVDERGMTLYIYTPDDRGHSVCSGICSVQWPPLLLSGTEKRPPTGQGVDRALLGVVRRGDGSLQLTYNEWPLYTYRLDKFPGEATGEENDMGLWQVISPSGQPVS